MVKALVANTLVFHIIQLYLQLFLELLRGFSFALIDVTFKCLLRSLITRFSSLMSLVRVLIAIFLNKLFTPTQEIGSHKEMTYGST